MRAKSEEEAESVREVRKQKKYSRNAERFKRALDMMLMAFAFSLFFGIIIIPHLRESIGNALNVVFMPLVSISGNFLVTIFIIAVITGIYTSLIQKFTMNFELIQRSKQLQARLRKVQREYMQARKENDKKKLKKIEQEQKRLMSEQMRISGEMFRQNMKPMAYSIIITLPIFFWIWDYVHNNDVIVRFPMMSAPCHLTDTLFFLQYWIIWYFICSILTTTIVRKVLGI